MSQQQKRPGTSSVATDGGRLGGNPNAKIAVSRSHEILDAPTPPSESTEDWLRTMKQEPNGKGNFGGITLYEAAGGITNMIEALSYQDSKIADIMRNIEIGYIDPLTMEWTGMAKAYDRKICICLVPTCNIGPFIPFRK